jgi:hypothetical protein
MAKKLITLVELDSLMSRDFPSYDELIGHINIRFNTNWQLVLAHKELQAIIKSLEYAETLLTEAYNEFKSDPEYSTLTTGCQNLKNQILVLSKKIEQIVLTIIKTTDYKEQVKLYEQHQEAERQREHETSLVAAKLTQNSLEREKDRKHATQENALDRTL